MVSLPATFATTIPPSVLPFLCLPAHHTTPIHIPTWCSCSPPFLYLRFYHTHHACTFPICRFPFVVGVPCRTKPTTYAWFVRSTYLCAFRALHLPFGRRFKPGFYVCYLHHTPPPHFTWNSCPHYSAVLLRSCTFCLFSRHSTYHHRKPPYHGYCSLRLIHYYVLHLRSYTPSRPTVHSYSTWLPRYVSAHLPAYLPLPTSLLWDSFPHRLPPCTPSCLPILYTTTCSTFTYYHTTLPFIPQRSFVDFTHHTYFPGSTFLRLSPPCRRSTSTTCACLRSTPTTRHTCLPAPPFYTTFAFLPAPATACAFLSVPVLLYAHHCVYVFTPASPPPSLLLPTCLAYHHLPSLFTHVCFFHCHLPLSLYSPPHPLPHHHHAPAPVLVCYGFLTFSAILVSGRGGDCPWTYHLVGFPTSVLLLHFAVHAARSCCYWVLPLCHLHACRRAFVLQLPVAHTTGHTAPVYLRTHTHACSTTNAFLHHATCTCHTDLYSCLC